MGEEKNNEQSFDGLNRRNFLKVAGLSSAAVLTGCTTPPSNRLLPYLVPPENLVPGVSLWYKSTCRECPAGCGTLVRTREGRTLKIEGNPEHPVNRGKLCIRGQAAVQGLYDPDRIAQPLRRDENGKFVSITWEEAETLLFNLLTYFRTQKLGSQIALLSHRVTGSLDRFFREWMEAHGSKSYFQYEPFAYESLRAANEITFGTSEIPRYDLAKAKVLLSFGADFLETWISNTSFAFDFAEMRRFVGGKVGRFVQVEARQSLTAANADEWFAPRPGTERFVALGMIHEILKSGRATALSADEAARLKQRVAKYDAASVSLLTEIPAEKISWLAHLFASANPGLALGGGIGSSGIHATATQVAVNLLNAMCGNVGKTVRFGEGADFDNVLSMKDMLALRDRMNQGEVKLLLLHHVNPVHAMPAAAQFSEALRTVPFKVSFSSVMDETTAMADLVLPDLTPLERWEDYAPRAGVYSIVQPTMQSIVQAKAAADVLLTVSQRSGGDLAKQFPHKDFRAYLEEHWKQLHKAFGAKEEFSEWFRRRVEEGGAWKAATTKSVRLTDRALRFEFEKTAEAERKDGHCFLMAYPSLQFFDGRGANRSWLQETPDAMTKIVWDSWAEIHADTAKQRGIREGDLLKISSPHGSVQVAAHLTYGIRPDTIAIPLGQGHRGLGRFAKDRGVNPMQLLSTQLDPLSGGLAWFGTRITIEKLALNRPLVKTQEQNVQLGRGFAQAISLKELIAHAEGRSAEPEATELPQMYKPHAHPEHRWGMAIDLNACIGCNACVAACYAENNVAIVGKEQVQRGRHMAWIRIERYYEPEERSHDVRFTPMLCQHCDNAPCESVCPVYATYHNNEGLNAQIYNRCVGTRYCSNNCPYHVRRFNWFDYEAPWPLPLQFNPDVSVRSKGVMEKCTFCVQRIREGKDHAKDEKRTVHDGEIVPACAQTCPTNAIVFGDLNDPNSRVSQMQKDARGYRVLEELNTKSAITYLKKIKPEQNW